jgi:predicted nucleic acid-binding protein
MSLKFGLDTSCLVPLLSVGHVLHVPTREGYAARRRRGEQPVVPVHALLEAYSVLTRSPAPLFVPPEQARRLLVENFFDHAEIPGISAQLAWSEVDELAARSLGGGLLYDAIIAQCCLDAGAELLITWNVRDFLRVAPPALQIREPAL